MAKYHAEKLYRSWKKKKTPGKAYLM